MTPSRAASTVLRRFAGAEADELAILCRPEESAPDTARQSEAVYRALASVLATEGAGFRELASETLFLRDIRRDLPLVLDARTRILGDLGQGAGAVSPSFIQQAPLEQGAAFALAASAVVPRNRDAWSVRDVPAERSCGCAGCARSAARLIRIGEQTTLHSTNLYGVGGDAFEQAADMFRAAEHLLERCGMGFRDVVRTWIHLRDIDRDYDALNTARREFFQRHGIEPRPASTGVQGGPFPDGHDFALRLEAVQSSRPVDIAPMSTPMLNEAWSYGADFSRGLRVADRNKVALYVSGTASIDEAGRTVHVGDFAAQADRMLGNIASLLSAQGATFGNLVSGIVYLRSPNDVTALRSICRQQGFDGFPCAVVEAPLCRPELLCEAEAVAMLPLPAVGA